MDSLFEVETPLGFRVRVPVNRWELIVTLKHPAMLQREDAVAAALATPEEVRQSNSSTAVYLFYKLDRPGRWICAVARRVDDRDGFLITAYPTDAIKEGTRVWTQ